MRKAMAPALRSLLRGKHEAGATATQLAAEVGAASAESVFTALRNMPDAYIDRWLETYHMPPSAVWCVVVPPDDMPKPERKRK